MVMIMMTLVDGEHVAIAVTLKLLSRKASGRSSAILDCALVGRINHDQHLLFQSLSIVTHGIT